MVRLIALALAFAALIAPALASTPTYERRAAPSGLSPCYLLRSPEDVESCLNDEITPSGLPRRRRGIVCPKSHQACTTSRGWECLNTAINLEACGGCPGQGVDCTDIPGVGSVSCQVGQCVVHSCMRGYVLVDGGCAKV